MNKNDPTLLFPPVFTHIHLNGFQVGRTKELFLRDFFAITNKNGGVPETIQTLKHLGTKGLLGSRKQSHLQCGPLRSAPVDV